MQTKLSPEFKNSQDGKDAESILRTCVHCGFCNATCPTYQILGDELDGPRGRIYLIKEMLEGGAVGRSTQQHLDRCLTCLNCETTCPSGVQYGKLVSIGRALVDRRVGRPARRRDLRRIPGSRQPPATISQPAAFQGAHSQWNGLHKLENVKAKNKTSVTLAQSQIVIGWPNQNGAEAKRSRPAKRIEPRPVPCEALNCDQTDGHDSLSQVEGPRAAA